MIMSEEIKKYLKDLVNGQKRQAERDDIVLSEVSEIRKTVERLHERLDGIHETTIIHSQEIKTLEKQQCKQDDNCKIQHELIWEKMRERKKEAVSEAVQKLKIWILVGLLSGTSALGLAMFSAFIKQ